MARDGAATQEAVRQKVESIASSAGLEVVEVQLRRSGRRWLLRIDIDRPGPRGVTVDDCHHVSRELERVLDAEDLVPGSYTLEVSSPGLDRPILTPDDVRRNAGREVTVRTTEPVQGRETFEGVMVGLEGEELRLVDRESGQEVRIPWSAVAHARQRLPF